MKLCVTKEWFEKRADLEGDLEINNKSCFCRGPQPGQTKCPCTLREEAAAATRGQRVELVPVTVID